MPRAAKAARAYKADLGRKWREASGARGFARFFSLPVATAGFAASFVLAPVWRSRGRNLRSFGAGEAGKEAGAGAAAHVSKRVGGGPAGLHTGLFGIMVFCKNKYSIHSKL
jgi:hypothetical protein